jgi:hypothetical protein
VSGGGSGTGGGGGTTGDAVSDKLSAYDRAVLMANQNDRDDEKVRLAELSALVELGLGTKLNVETFSKLAEIQFSLRQEQKKLATILQDGKITEKQYLGYFNSALSNAINQTQKLLGPDRFKAIFGEAGYQPEQLIDPEIFLNQQSHGPARS